MFANEKVWEGSNYDQKSERRRPTKSPSAVHAAGSIVDNKVPAITASGYGFQELCRDNLALTEKTVAAAADSAFAASDLAFCAAAAASLALLAFSHFWTVPYFALHAKKQWGCRVM